MDYEELKSIWKQYDQKLDRLEKLNRKLITETMARKPQKKINRLLFQNVYGIIISPVILIVVLYPYFKQGNFDLFFLSGCALLLMSMLSIITIYYRGYLSLRKINLQKDSVVESAQKVNNFKNIMYDKMKFIYIISLFMFAGIVLVIWDGLHFNLKTIIGFSGLLALTIVWTYKKSRMQVRKIERLKKDILELGEYK